jgi:emp24/gp25L/p24 family/GOLD
MAASSPSSMLMLLVATLWIISIAQGYPLIAQVSESHERCFKFNIPEDDDAHLLFLALPLGEELGDGKEGKVEGWIVQEIYEMTKKRMPNGDMPTSMLHIAPEEVKEVMASFVKKRGDNLSKLKVVVSVDSVTTSSRVLPVKYFVPTVINKVREAHSKILSETAVEEDPSALSGYTVCFNNLGNEEESIQVIMDIVMLSAEPEEPNEPNFVKEKHLSPLEESLEKSIKAANTVLKEMKYMTDREERMRLTADSINQRVQYFSIISVVILLTVTYIQVTYLKRYFKKKKLM